MHVKKHVEQQLDGKKNTGKTKAQKNLKVFLIRGW